MLEAIKRDLGIEKENVLHVAQALMCDHMPAKKMDMHSAWIHREDEEQKLVELKGQLDFTWQFKNVGEMAAVLDEEFVLINVD